MATLTQEEIDVLTCDLCDDAALVVAEHAHKPVFVSLCRQCLVDMLAGINGEQVSH